MRRVHQPRRPVEERGGRDRRTPGGSRLQGRQQPGDVSVMGLDRGAGPAEPLLITGPPVVEGVGVSATMSGEDGITADVRDYLVDSFEQAAVGGVYRTVDTEGSGAWFGGYMVWELVPNGGAFSLGSGHMEYTPSGGSNGVARLRSSGDGLTVSNEETDDPDEEEGDEPWTVDGGCRMSIRFRPRGVTSGFFRMRWDDGSGWVSAKVTIDAGEATLNVSGDGGNDTSAVVPSPDPDAWYCMWLDTRMPGVLRGRAWEERDADVKWSGEWTAIAHVPLDLTVDVDETEPPDESLELKFDGHWQVATLSASGPALQGQLTHEYIGQGNDDREQFLTSMPYRYGSLTGFWVAGQECRAREIDPFEGRFRVVDSIAPRQGMRMTVLYVADYEQDDGTEDPTADDSADDPDV